MPPGPVFVSISTSAWGGSRFSRAVLLVGNLLHPVDHLAVLDFLQADMSHARRRRSAMPMLFARRKPDDIAGADFLNGPSPPLHPANPGGHNEHMSKGR